MAASAIPPIVPTPIAAFSPLESFFFPCFPLILSSEENSVESFGRVNCRVLLLLKPTEPVL